jgi:hypothetical protein
MRLIDADELIKGLKEDYDDIEVQKVLERLGIYTYIGTVQPTAYDVDKVIKELKGNVGTIAGCQNKEDCNWCKVNRECKIIKRGGIE